MSIGRARMTQIRARVEQAHFPVDNLHGDDGRSCWTCRYPWPCWAALLLDELSVLVEESE